MTGLGVMPRLAKLDSTAGLQDLTLVSSQNDPSRLDTPAGHAKGRWFRAHMARCGLRDRSAPIRICAVHYRIIPLGATQPPTWMRRKARGGHGE